jgi:hypothetical protein
MPFTWSQRWNLDLIVVIEAHPDIYRALIVEEPIIHLKGLG